jgi:hypothetical protein
MGEAGFALLWKSMIRYLGNSLRVDSFQVVSMNSIRKTQPRISTQGAVDSIPESSLGNTGSGHGSRRLELEF